jgi:hypothetical protein
VKQTPKLLRLVYFTRIFLSIEIISIFPFIDSVEIVSEPSATVVLPSSSSTIDDEARRRKILSKLWGKGNKLSHKVRELDKSTITNSSDSSIHNDNDQQVDNHNNLSSYSSANDPKASTEDSSNSINSSKPLAVVKPIVVLKSGLIVAHATDRTRVNSEASSTTITQKDATTTVSERQSTSSTKKNDRTSSKKKKSHKNEDSKKKKTTKERDRSHHQVISNKYRIYFKLLFVFPLPRPMKIQIKKVVQIIDENKMKNLLVIIHLQQLLYPITDDDHHQTMLIL